MTLGDYVVLFVISIGGIMFLMVLLAVLLIILGVRSVKNYAAFHIDIRGVWSHRQAEKIIEALEAEAAERGMRLVAVDCSTHTSPHRAIISVYCRAHQAAARVPDHCSICRAVQELS